MLKAIKCSLLALALLKSSAVLASSKSNDSNDSNDSYDTKYLFNPTRYDPLFDMSQDSFWRISFATEFQNAENDKSEEEKLEEEEAGEVVSSFWNSKSYQTRSDSNALLQSSTVLASTKSNDSDDSDDSDDLFNPLEDFDENLWRTAVVSKPKNDVAFETEENLEEKEADEEIFSSIWNSKSYQTDDISRGLVISFAGHGDNSSEYSFYQDAPSAYADLDSVLVPGSSENQLVRTSDYENDFEFRIVLNETGEPIKLNEFFNQLISEFFRISNKSSRSSIETLLFESARDFLNSNGVTLITMHTNQDGADVIRTFGNYSPSTLLTDQEDQGNELRMNENNGSTGFLNIDQSNMTGSNFTIAPDNSIPLVVNGLHEVTLNPLPTIQVDSANLSAESLNTRTSTTTQESTTEISPKTESPRPESESDSDSDDDSSSDEVLKTSTSSKSSSNDDENDKENKKTENVTKSTVNDAKPSESKSSSLKKVTSPSPSILSDSNYSWKFYTVSGIVISLIVSALAYLAYIYYQKNQVQVVVDL